MEGPGLRKSRHSTPSCTQHAPRLAGVPEISHNHRQTVDCMQRLPPAGDVHVPFVRLAWVHHTGEHHSEMPRMSRIPCRMRAG